MHNIEDPTALIYPQSDSDRGSHHEKVLTEVVTTKTHVRGSHHGKGSILVKIAKKGLKTRKMPKKPKSDVFLKKRPKKGQF